MKKNLIAAAIGFGLLASGSTAIANTLTFNEASGASFTQDLWVTPNATNDLLFSVFGLASQFSSLSFSFADIPALTVPATLLSSGTLKASFDDLANNAFSNQFSLIGGHSYRVTVSGQTVPGILGGHGTVTVSALGVVAVPEPESYAMLLAGLGLLGLIARRRAKAAA